MVLIKIKISILFDMQISDNTCRAVQNYRKYLSGSIARNATKEQLVVLIGNTQNKKIKNFNYFLPHDSYFFMGLNVNQNNIKEHRTHRIEYVLMSQKNK